MPTSRESMSSVDLAWLRMERPTNPMMIVAVLTFATRLKYDALRQLLLTRLLAFERFRQLPAHDAFGTHWQTDPQFDIDSHLHRLSLPPRARQSHLEAAASDLASTPLDPRRPLWQVHLIERYRKGSALIACFHHCYADGVALMRLLLSLTDADARGRPPESLAPPPARTADAAGLLSLGPLLTNVFGAMQNAGRDAYDLVAASLRTLSNPEVAADISRQAAAATAELASIAMLPDDPRTPLKGELSARKQVAWIDPLPLGEVKATAKALGCTINDVLLATAAGALGAHLRASGAALDGLSVRALVPVNLRPADAPPALGNHFGLVFANLPIGERNPLARLYAVHLDMERLKHSSQAVLALWLITAMGALPAAFEERSIGLLTSKASVVVSNVPGPQQALYLAGARIEEQFYWVPQSGEIGVGLSMLTYDGKVHFGVIADRNLIPKPHSLAQAFAAAFGELRECVLHGLAPTASAIAAPTHGERHGSSP
jgi:diacylglycerol O-acyltransferase / wax synthase